MILDQYIHLCLNSVVCFFVLSIVAIHESDKCARLGLLEQICDEKSRPRGNGPSSQPIEEVASSGGLFSSTFSSWGKKLNSALDSGKAKVRIL